jgi:hypothetical protein
MQPAHSSRALAQLAEQAALADALLAGELHDPPRPAPRGGDRLVERGDLALAADQREDLGDALARAAADRGADRPRLDARAISRADRLVASPITAYVRR